MSDTEEQGQEQAPAVDETLTTAALADAATAPKPVAEEARTFAAPPAGTPAEVKAAAPADEKATPLFSQEEAGELRAKWDALQASFVDEPRRVVEQADSLVATTMKRLAEIFAAERGNLEGQWDRGDDVSTEDLRQALRRYRSFFGRLLAI